MEMGKLIEADLRSCAVEHKPPCISKDRCGADIGTNDHVTEEQPPVNEGFVTLAWLSFHDIMIRRVER